jgi:hypothetical protein
MVLSDMIYGAGDPAGWAMLPEANDKERRFCRKIGLEIVEFDIPALLSAASPGAVAAGAAAASVDIGC